VSCIPELDSLDNITGFYLRAECDFNNLKYIVEDSIKQPNKKDVVVKWFKLLASDEGIRAISTKYEWDKSLRGEDNVG